jgi:hypothetical protein
MHVKRSLAANAESRRQVKKKEKRSAVLRNWRSLGTILLLLPLQWWQVSGDYSHHVLITWAWRVMLFWLVISQQFACFMSLIFRASWTVEDQSSGDCSQDSSILVSWSWSWQSRKGQYFWEGKVHQYYAPVVWSDLMDDQIQCFSLFFLNIKEA